LRHQLTSSSDPGSTPARTMAAARSAYSALWCWAFVWARAREGGACGSHRTRAVAPGALLSSMASVASSSRTSPGKVLFFGCSGASRAASPHRAPDHPRHPIEPPASPWPDLRPSASSALPSPRRDRHRLGEDRQPSSRCGRDVGISVRAGSISSLVCVSRRPGPRLARPMRGGSGWAGTAPGAFACGRSRKFRGCIAELAR
jgi:hypothetical protein